MLKQNRGFRRFLLRGIDKVAIEFGLLALAHNLKKMTQKHPFLTVFDSLLMNIKQKIPNPILCAAN
jgi:hypothetical protein